MEPNQKADWQRIQDADDQELTAFVIELSRPYLEKYPQHGIAWLIYAIALSEIGQYSEAENALQSAIACFPQKHLHMPYLWLGHVYKAQGDYEQAEVWYKKACNLSPDDATYWISLGSNSFRMGDITQAECYARQAIKCQEGCLDEAYFNLGGYLLTQRQYEEAEVCYKKALELDPEYNIAKLRLKDVQAVIAFFQQTETSQTQEDEPAT